MKKYEGLSLEHNLFSTLTLDYCLRLQPLYVRIHYWKPKTKDTLGG
jgi:hypothetical protein